MSFDVTDPAHLQIVYQELEGTLSGGGDPAQPSTGSQCTTYGYCIGNGSSLEEKHELYTKIQDNGTGRPIDVETRANASAGKVVEPIFAQTIQENIDWNEYDANRTGGSSLEQTQIQWLELVFLSANPDARWALTDKLQGRLNQLFDAVNWPVTRADLFADFTRPGSRSEEQWGIQLSVADFYAVEDWRRENSPGSPSLYT